jgi:hypothetical protein
MNNEYKAINTNTNTSPMSVLPSKLRRIVASNYVDEKFEIPKLERGKNFELNDHKPSIFNFESLVNSSPLFVCKNEVTELEEVKEVKEDEEVKEVEVKEVVEVDDICSNKISS